MSALSVTEFTCWHLVLRTRMKCIEFIQVIIAGWNEHFQINRYVSKAAQ